MSETHNTLYTERDNRRMAVGVEFSRYNTAKHWARTQGIEQRVWSVCAGGIGETKRREFYSRRFSFCLANGRQDTPPAKWLLLFSYLTLVLYCFWEDVDEKSLANFTRAIFKLTQRATVFYDRLKSTDRHLRKSGRVGGRRSLSEKSQRNIYSESPIGKMSLFTHSAECAQRVFSGGGGWKEGGGGWLKAGHVCCDHKRKALGYIECARNTGKFWSG